MDSFPSILNIVKPNCWMVNMDLKDALYIVLNGILSLYTILYSKQYSCTVPIHLHHLTFLKFKWQQHYYACREMPNGSREAMKVFTKLLKPSFPILRNYGYLSGVFTGNSYLEGYGFSIYEGNINATVNLSQSLGFIIHPAKSVLIPTHAT